MTRKQFEGFVKPFTEEADKDQDPYYLIHFSRTEDCFTGFENALEFPEALIIVSGLCAKFGIEPSAIPVKDFMKPSLK